MDAEPVRLEALVDIIGADDALVAAVGAVALEAVDVVDAAAPVQTRARQALVHVRRTGLVWKQEQISH